MPRSLDDSVGDLLASMGEISRRAQGPAIFSIGEVTVGTQEGLKVQCGGTELTVKDLWINAAQPALEAGDRVVLLTQDEQAYYLLCKAVKLA